MKRFIFLATLSVILTGIIESKPYIQISGNISVFYSSLSRHGEWIETDWGQAWRPLHVVHGWRPYLYGRWVWTDYGWYWVSYEPFGWATFHYGRWYYDDYYGWIWIPGYDWGPAWVEWRYDDDYIGWAPLPPFATFSINVGISFSSHWVAPIHYWNFIPCRNFTATRVVEYVQPLERTRRIYGNTRSGELIRGESDRIINRGVDVNFIERKTKTRINRIEVIQHDRNEGEKFIRDRGNERIEVFRPKFDDRVRGTNNRPEDKIINKGEQRRNLDIERKRGEPIEGTGREQKRLDSKPQYEGQKERERIIMERKSQDIQRMRELKQDKLEFRRNEQRRIEQQKPEQRLRENPKQEQPRLQMRDFPQQRERKFTPQRQENPQRGMERKRRP